MRIEATGITVHRGGRALLDGVSASFPAGELTAVVGPNGAGKTTFLQVISGDVAPDVGRVTWGGAPLTGLDPKTRARCRAVLPQESSIAFGFTALQIVTLGRLPWDEPRASTEAYARDALDQVGLTSLEGRSWLTLSGGERQRVQIARILTQVVTFSRGIVLLDEPTNHLDIAHQVQVLELGRRLAQRGLTVVAVLHDLALAARTADRVLLLDNARAVAQGTPAQVFDPARLSAAFDIGVRLLSDPLESVQIPIPELSASPELP